MLESISELRCPRREMTDIVRTRIANSIEREVAKRYIPCPVDADGVPWEPSEVEFVDPYGEKRALVSMTYIVDSHNSKIRHWLLEGFNSTNNQEFRADKCRHVKPRTFEDVLRDVWNEALDYAKSDMWRNPEDVFTERADELRKIQRQA